MVFLYICKMLRDNTLDNYYREQSLHSLRITELTVLTLAFVSICELPRPQNNDQVFLIHWTNFVYPFGIFYAGKLLGSWGALSINKNFIRKERDIQRLWGVKSRTDSTNSRWGKSGQDTRLSSSIYFSFFHKQKEFKRGIVRNRKVWRNFN